MTAFDFKPLADSTRNVAGASWPHGQRLGHAPRNAARPWSHPRVGTCLSTIVPPVKLDHAPRNAARP
ncbi:MAG TPA: hypothetical protein VFG83_14765, partial [Kofleriaceae bacterium]|nr:hypothetical protein [Kofleriaceae bacterium]